MNNDDDYDRSYFSSNWHVTFRRIVDGVAATGYDGYTSYFPIDKDTAFYAALGRFMFNAEEPVSLDDILFFGVDGGTAGKRSFDISH